MIQAADNEAQLAAMMGHAVAHVAARHAAKQAGKAAFINILSVPSTTLPNAAFQQSQAPAVPSMFYAFSRQAETEADSAGLQYLYKAGYDPTAMAAFFQKLAGQTTGDRKVSSLFATHPPTADRATKSEESVKTLPARQQNVIDTAEFQVIKGRLP
jgi:predicted Zn-dependent protease